MTHTSRTWRRAGLRALIGTIPLVGTMVLGGCAHNRESLYPPSNKMARSEPALDPLTPGVTVNASAKPSTSSAGGATTTAKRPETRSREVDSSADTFDFDAYRD